MEIQTKNAYSSKNKGFTHSLAVAGKQGGFEGASHLHSTKFGGNPSPKDTLKRRAKL